MRKIIMGLLATLLLLAGLAPAASQQTLPANTVLGRLGIGPGPAQAIPFSVLTGNLLLSVITGDCTVSASNVITCTRINGTTVTTSITSARLIGGTTASSTLTLDSTSGAGTTDTIRFRTASQTVVGTFEPPVTPIVPTGGAAAPYPLIIRAGTACAGSSVYTTPGIGPAPSNGQLFLCADQATSAAGNFSGLFAVSYNLGTRFNAAVTGIGVMPNGTTGGNAWGGQFSAIAAGNAAGVLQGANIEADWSTGSVIGIGVTIKLGDSAGGSTASPGLAYISTLSDAGKAPLFGWRLDAVTRSPIASTGAIIKIDGSTLASADGIDLRGGTYTTCAYRGTGFCVNGSGAVSSLTATAIPAGGSASVALYFSTTAGFGIFFGSGAPTLSAAKGSIYLRSDGAINARLYINTDGSTAWTAFNTAS